MSQAKIRDAFPRLNKAPFNITSSENPFYNCVAWAADDSARWWWPINYPGQLTKAYWPPNVDRREDIASFIAAYATLGYEPCDNGKPEEKVALFADAQGRPKHAAKQLPNGKWTSKLGSFEDISHLLYGLEGGQYGNVVQYLRRKLRA